MDTPIVQPVDLLSTDEPADLPLSTIHLPLPAWLSAASQETRDEYGRQLTAYHACANALESHLDKEVPSFDDFVREQLAARIKTDFGLDIDPDRVIVDLPKRVHRDYAIDPQLGHVKNHFARWVAGATREQLTLCELARRSFLADDEQMGRRLDFAVIEQDTATPAPGLNGRWVYSAIPQLNVAQRYLNRLDKVFATSTSQTERETDLLLAPYEAQILLEGFCEHARKRLSKEGYWLLQLAAQTRSSAEAHAANIELSWLELKPGTSVSGERNSRTVRGVCRVRDRDTGLCIIYLPDAPIDRPLIEATDSANALERLIEHLNRTPALVDYLAERTRDPHEAARQASYIRQALARGFDGFAQFVPALDLHMSMQQLQARAWPLYHLAQANARSQAVLRRQHHDQQNTVYLGYFKALLSLMPGIGTLISLEEGWTQSHDAMQAFHEGRVDDGLLALGSTALNILDVGFTVVPGAASIFMIARMARRGAGVHKAASALRQHVLKPFEGYEVSTSLSGAVPQFGRDLGAVLKDGQLWIEREGRAYAVYRRSGEQTLRLRKTATHGYEPPVRFEQGDWAYHGDVGLRGGVRSAIAEALIVNTHADPAFRTRHARELLDQFDFPVDRQRRLELDIAVHYQKHRTVPGWAEAYRRPAEPAQAAPQPGPSGVKRKEPSTADPQATRAPQPGPSRLASQATAADPWKVWGRTPGDAAGFQSVDTAPPIFTMSGEQGTPFIQIDGMRYDILPSGASQHPSMVFLKNPSSTSEGFSGLNETIRRAAHEQPVMAAFKDGKWTVHGPLFKRKIQQLVDEARPGFTATSCRVLAEKLFDAADHAHAGLTSSRLITMKATLSAWKKGGVAPLPELADPLLMLEGSRLTGIGTHNPRLRSSYGPSLKTFNRLDFDVTGSPLKEGLERVLTGVFNKKTATDFMADVLTRAGYKVVAKDDAILHARTIMLFRRPGQEPLYMLNVRRFIDRGATFHMNHLDGAVPLSNRWIDEWRAAYPGERAFQTLVEARDQGLLVKLVGGIGDNLDSYSGPKVFVQRLVNDF